MLRKLQKTHLRLYFCTLGGVVETSHPSDVHLCSPDHAIISHACLCFHHSRLKLLSPQAEKRPKNTSKSNNMGPGLVEACGGEQKKTWGHSRYVLSWGIEQQKCSLGVVGCDPIHIWLSQGPMLNEKLTLLCPA